MEQRIKDEQLKLLFAGLPWAVLTTLLLVALTVAVAELIGVPNVLVASGGILIVTTLRFVLWLAYRRYHQRDPTRHENAAWSRLFFVGAVTAGLAWGITAVVIFPRGDIAAQAFLSFLIGGLSAGAVSLLSADRRNLIAFVLPCVLPVAVRLYMEPGDYSHVMGLMGLLYMIVILASGMRLHSQIYENIVLRLEASEQQRLQQRSEHNLALVNQQLRDSVSEREHATEALRRLNERFELATHSGGMGIWDWDVAKDTLVWDERTYEIYGAARTVKPDMNYMLRTIHPDDVVRARNELIEALKGQPTRFRTTFRIICPSGEERVVSASGLTLRNANGRAVRMTGLIWDVTENQRVERMKNEFVATVSHELRTPLTSIRGSLGLVAAGVAGMLPERATNLVNMALNNCERLTQLINDILDIEKLESDKQRFDVRRVEVAELVERSIEENTGFAQSLSVRFTTPQPLCDAAVMVDPVRFLQVMANLLSNASKFSPTGAAIEVTALRERDRVRIAVRDYGKGIPPEFQSRIFQKFSQADSSDSRRMAGTGLGLAISRAIVERLGGTIGFHTGAAGTTFFFELPEASIVESSTMASSVLISRSDFS